MHRGYFDNVPRRATPIVHFDGRPKVPDQGLGIVARELGKGALPYADGVPIQASKPVKIFSKLDLKGSVRNVTDDQSNEPSVSPKSPAAIKTASPCARLLVPGAAVPLSHHTAPLKRETPEIRGDWKNLLNDEYQMTSASYFEKSHPNIKEQAQTVMVGLYTNGDYIALNDALRGNGQLDALHLFMLRKIHGALPLLRVSVPDFTTRGVRHFEALDALEVGSEFTERGFFSTSSNGAFSTQPIQITVYGRGSEVDWVSMESEGEVVYPAGTTFVVDSISEDRTKFLFREKSTPQPPLWKYEVRGFRMGR